MNSDFFFQNLGTAARDHIISVRDQICTQGEFRAMSYSMEKWLRVRVKIQTRSPEILRLHATFICKINAFLLNKFFSSTYRGPRRILLRRLLETII